MSSTLVVLILLMMFWIDMTFLVHYPLEDNHYEHDDTTTTMPEENIHNLICWRERERESLEWIIKLYADDLNPFIQTMKLVLHQIQSRK
jgi:hypothetical protein